MRADLGEWMTGGVVEAGGRAAAGTCALSEAETGATCTVVRLMKASPDKLRRLLALGVLPGAQLELTQRWPGIVFRMGFSEFAMDHDLASTIVVRAQLP